MILISTTTTVTTTTTTSHAIIVTSLVSLLNEFMFKFIVEQCSYLISSVEVLSSVLDGFLMQLLVP